MEYFDMLAQRNRERRRFNATGFIVEQEHDDFIVEKLTGTDGQPYVSIGFCDMIEVCDIATIEMGKEQFAKFKEYINKLELE